MAGPFVSRVGGILSADIAVPEHERELRFYSRVLTTGENPLWQEDLMNNQGMPVIGLGKRTEELADLPLLWMPHIQVADVAASVQRALDLGGSELMHGKDDAGNSQWAVLRDPTGATFGIIPVVPPEMLAAGDGGAGAEAAAVGRIAWADLTIADAPPIRDFYREVVGWSTQDVEMQDGGDRYADYSMCGSDGEPAAGVCHARGMNADQPAVWMIYLPVGDLAESLRLVEEEGGKVIRTAHENDEYAFAIIQDPVGVHLGLVPGGGA